jgi:hypothetical protein
MFRLPAQSRFLRIVVVFSVFLLVAVLLAMTPAASPTAQGASFQRPSSIASWPLNLMLANAQSATAAAVDPIELRPPLRPLSAGEPQTITLEIVPATLIARSGMTAVVTATVIDLTGTPVSGVTLSGYITPAECGTLSPLPLNATNELGQSVGTWTAGTIAGAGSIEITTGVITGTADITLMVGTPATMTLLADPISLLVGGASVLTATVVDQYNNPVDDGTLVTFTSDIGTVLSPHSTSGGVATSTITSTVAGTAHVTATSGTASGFTSVVFNPDVPHTVTVSAEPPTLTVDAVSVLTATVVDQYNNPVSDDAIVTFTSDIGNVLSPRSTSGGVATTTIASPVVGAAHITATSGSASGFASVVFNPGSPYTVTLSAYPPIRTVGETSTLTATVVDQYNNPVVDGTIVTFTSDIGSVASPSSTSDGIATSTITSPVVGTAHITATSGSASGFASVIFNPHTVFLPSVISLDRRALYSTWSVQFYDQIAAWNGFDQATAAGVRWIRMRVSWFNIEPTNTVPANYNWSALDQSIAAADAAKINLVVTLEGNPGWAASRPQGPVNNLNDFKQFAGALAARYPTVQYWEIYNEPDNRHNFGDQPSAYAAHLNAAYTAIKAANANAKIVMGGVAMDWFTDDPYPGNFVRTFVSDVLTACTQPCFDVGNFHFYPVYRGKWESYGRDIIGKANAFRQRLSAKGYSRPVMNTETGWVYSTIPNTDWGGEAVQGRYVPKTFVRGIAANLLTTNWYAMIDADPSQPGLLGGTSPFQLREAYTATVKLGQQLGAAKYERALTKTETGSANLEGYVFTNYEGAHGTERVDIIWYDCPGLIVDTPNLPVDCTNSAIYTVPAAPIGVADHLSGAVQILTDNSDGVVDGKVKIAINRNPVYIHYNP